MSRKWIGGLLTVAALAAAGVAATSVLGAEDGGDSPRPAYATVEVDLSEATPAAATAVQQAQDEEAEADLPAEPGPGDDQPGAGDRGRRRPEHRRRSSPAARRSSTAASCRAGRDVFVQGTYVANAGEYHVLIGLEDQDAAGRNTHPVHDHLAPDLPQGRQVARPTGAPRPPDRICSCGPRGARTGRCLFHEAEADRCADPDRRRDPGRRPRGAANHVHGPPDRVARLRREAQGVLRRPRAGA